MQVKWECFHMMSFLFNENKVIRALDDLHILCLICVHSFGDLAKAAIRLVFMAPLHRQPMGSQNVPLWHFINLQLVDWNLKRTLFDPPSSLGVKEDVAGQSGIDPFDSPTIDAIASSSGRKHMTETTTKIRQKDVALCKCSITEAVTMLQKQMFVP